MNLPNLILNSGLVLAVMGLFATVYTRLTGEFEASLAANETIAAITRCAARGEWPATGDAARNGCEVPEDAGDWANWVVDDPDPDDPDPADIIRITVEEPDARQRRAAIRAGGQEDDDGNVEISLPNPRAAVLPRHRHMGRLIDGVADPADPADDEDN